MVAVGIDELLEFVDDAVAVSGRFRVIEARHPLHLMLFVAGADLVHDFRFDSPRCQGRCAGERRR